MRRRKGFSGALLFSCPGFATSLLTTTVAMFLMYYYTDVLLLPVGVVAVLLPSLRFFDGAIDPFISYAMDRRTTRFGKYRGYILYFSLPACVLFALTFWPVPSMGVWGKVVWQVVCYGGWCLFFSLIECAYLPMLVTAGPAKEAMRQRHAVKLFVSIAAALLVRFFMLKLVGLLGGGHEAGGFFTVACVCAGLALAAFVPVLFIRERPVEHTNPLSLRGLGKILFSKNRTLLYILVFFMLNQIASAVKNQAAIYYMKYYIGRAELTPVFLSVSVLSSLLAQPLIYCAAKRIKPIVLIIAGYIGAAVFIGIMSLGNAFLPVLLGGNILYGVCSAFPANLVFLYTAEISLEMSGAHGSSLYATATSFLSMGSRIGMVVGPTVVSFMLWATDYIPNIKQNNGVLFGIQACFVFVSMVLYLLAAVFALLAHRCRKGVDTYCPPQKSSY